LVETVCDVIALGNRPTVAQVKTHFNAASIHFGAGVCKDGTGYVAKMWYEVPSGSKELTELDSQFTFGALSWTFPQTRRNEPWLKKKVAGRVCMLVFLFILLASLIYLLTRLAASFVALELLLPVVGLLPVVEIIIIIITITITTISISFAGSPVCARILAPAPLLEGLTVRLWAHSQVTQHRLQSGPPSTLRSPRRLWTADGPQYPRYPSHSLQASVRHSLESSEKEPTIKTQARVPMPRY
jgi:hypothetical protein